MVINILSNRSKWTFYFLSSVQFNFTIGEKFIDEEEYHLADVFIAGLQNNKLSSTDLIKWFNSFNFNPESSSQIEFHRFGNLKSFAEDIYVKLNTANLLDGDLKKYIEKEFSQMY